MTDLLTTAGVTHLSEILSASPLTNTFDGFELDQSNHTPASADDRSSFTAKVGNSLIPVASGYPILGDEDIRNEDRGANTYTWKFVIPEGIQVIASGSLVTNYSAGVPLADEPVMVSSNTVLAKRSDQELTVFVNVSTAGATSLVAHVAEGTPLVEQMASWRAQSIALSGAPGATPSTNGIVQSKANEGEQIWLGARILGANGGVLTRSEVTAIRFTALKRDREREWVIGAEFPLEVYSTITAAPVRTDHRWRGSQGYNFAHAWLPPLGWGSRRTRIEYTLTLNSGDSRTLVHEIEWASMRAL